jgi:hypothetical protein
MARSRFQKKSLREQTRGTLENLTEIGTYSRGKDLIKRKGSLRGIIQLNHAVMLGSPQARRGAEADPQFCQFLAPPRQR